jgi:hypothetical protein
MKVEDFTTYEQHLDAPDGATLGWLARYGSGQALWCGALSRAEFRLQSEEVRAALRDDFGWFLVDYDLKSPEKPFSRVLGKAACERTGLELMQLIIQGRLCAALDSRRSPSLYPEIPVATKHVVAGLRQFGR